MRLQVFLLTVFLACLSNCCAKTANDTVRSTRTEVNKQVYKIPIFSQTIHWKPEEIFRLLSKANPYELFYKINGTYKRLFLNDTVDTLFDVQQSEGTTKLSNESSATETPLYMFLNLSESDNTENGILSANQIDLESFESATENTRATELVNQSTEGSKETNDFQSEKTKNGSRHVREIQYTIDRFGSFRSNHRRAKRDSDDETLKQLLNINEMDESKTKKHEIQQNQITNAEESENLEEVTKMRNSENLEESKEESGSEGAKKLSSTEKCDINEEIDEKSVRLPRAAGEEKFDVRKENLADEKNIEKRDVKEEYEEDDEDQENFSNLAAEEESETNEISDRMMESQTEDKHEEPKRKLDSKNNHDLESNENIRPSMTNNQNTDLLEGSIQRQENENLENKINLNQLQALKHSSMMNDKSGIESNVRNHNSRIEATMEVDAGKEFNEANVKTEERVSGSKDDSEVEKSKGENSSSKETETEEDYEKRAEEEIQRKIDSIAEEIKREIEQKQQIREIEENNAKFDELQRQNDEGEERKENEESVESHNGKIESHFTRGSRGNLEGIYGNPKERSARRKRKEAKNSSETKVKKDKPLRRKNTLEQQQAVSEKSGSLQRRNVRQSPVKKREYTRQVILVKDGHGKRRRKRKRNIVTPGASLQNKRSALDSGIDSETFDEKEVLSGASGFHGKKMGKRTKRKRRRRKRNFALGFSGYRPQNVDDEENEEGNEFDDDGFDDRTSNLRERKSRRFRGNGEPELLAEDNGNLGIESSLVKKNSEPVVSLSGSSQELSPRLVNEYKGAFGGLQSETNENFARYKRVKRVLQSCYKPENDD